MIEIIDPERCTACNICVRVCPTNVFAIVPDEPPVIARQADCQTCFLCEAYCPVDALYVAPTADQAGQAQANDERVLSNLGGYRAALGWGPQRQPSAALDKSHELLPRAH